MHLHISSHVSLTNEDATLAMLKSSFFAKTCNTFVTVKCRIMDILNKGDVTSRLSKIWAKNKLAYT